MYSHPKILFVLLASMLSPGLAHPITSTGNTEPSHLNTRQAAGIDVGPCTDFSMSFKTGFAAAQSATEVRFGPSDGEQFSQGAALNPAIISNAMCGTFVNACAKSAVTRDTCKSVKSTIDAQLASGQLARDQSYADAWLSGLETAFGIKSTGRGTEGAGGSAGVAGGGAGAGAGAGGAAVTGAAAGAVDTGAGAGNQAGNGNGNAGAGTGTGCPAPAQASAGGNTTANTGADATDTGAAADTAGSGAADAGDGGAGSTDQTFTGSLNGIAATPVLQSDGARPFSVKGDTFVNSGAALQRSCDQQFNGCANAANSGQGAASVTECEAQKTACGQAVAGIAA